MLLREITAPDDEQSSTTALLLILTTNYLPERNAEFFNVNSGGTYNYHTHYRGNCTQANNRLASQKNSPCLQYQQFNHCYHKIPQLVRIPSQMSPVHTLLNTHFNSILARLPNGLLHTHRPMLT